MPACVTGTRNGAGATISVRKFSFNSAGDTTTQEHFGRGDLHCVRQALRIHRNVTLDPRDRFTGVIALERGCVRILYTLRVHDQERWTGAAPQFQTGCANLDFFKSRSKTLICRPGRARSAWKSTSAPCAIWENR